MAFRNFLLASSSALVLSATGALADNNEAYLDQVGEGNSALVDQSGSGAMAGDSNAQRRMTQDGDDNTLTVLQTGSGKVGTGSNYAQNNLGIDQLGDRNNLDVTQNFGSRVFEVQQDSTGATGPLASEGNSATITQTGNMRVSRVRQTYTGDGTAGTGNALTVVQSGGQFQQSGIGDFNGFNPSFGKQGVWQEGESNTATVTQDNAGQRLWLLDQNGKTNSFELTQTGGNGNKFQTAEQFGDGNTGTLTFTGTSNGAGGLSGTALASGAPSSSLLQYGNDNTVGMTITGDFNEFGAEQIGDLNDASILVTGVSNDVGTRQESNDAGNEITASIAGDDNDLGIVQTVGASKNAKSVAMVDIDGNNNLLNVNQNATRNRGGPQTVDVSITGNDNNRGSFDAGGNAGMVAASAGLNPGDMFQELNGASATITVLGNSNLFATFQRGNPGGSITGFIDGSDNQAAVVQLGNLNIASFNQNGSGNNAGIAQ